MPLMIDQTTKALELVQCRETTADAALKWAFFGALVSLAIGCLIGLAAPAYMEWKWRRKAQREGLRK